MILLREGAITLQTYSEGLSALKAQASSPQRERPTPAPRHERPTPAPRRERPNPAPRRERSTPAPRRERPNPAPRRERPTPAPRRERPNPAPRRERPTPAPRRERPNPAPRRERPTPAPRPQRERPNQSWLTDEELEKILFGNEPEELKFRQNPWVIGSFLRGWQMNVPEGHPLGADPKVFLEGVHHQIGEKLEEEIGALNGVKFQLALKVSLRKDGPDGSEELMEPVLRHKQEALLQPIETGASLDAAYPKILETLEKWTYNGSGWEVERVVTLWLDIAQYRPLRGGSYIELPAALKRKKVVVNVKNRDDDCLRWALRSALFPAKDHSDRPSKYPIEDGLDFTGIDSPTPLTQIGRVERQNDLAINVFGWDKGVIVHRLTKEDGPFINLLMVGKAEKYHYTWIKDINRLLYTESKHKERKHFCERCLHGYSREELLKAHKPECRGIGQTAVRVKMPEEGKNKLSFQNHCKQLSAPFVIYADFEALTTKIEGPALNPSKSNTQNTQEHEACSYCYLVVRSDGKTEPPVEYRGPNAAERFLRSLKEKERKIKRVLARPKAMRMTENDRQAHKAATDCHVCDKPLEGDSVRDHCHITGNYRGAAHNACNLKLRIDPKKLAIPVVFHNLRGYDSHFLMQAMSKIRPPQDKERGYKLSCIPNNTEKYISFSLGQLCFIDSAQFLLASLDKLVAANQPDAFRITARYEPDEARRSLLMRKGVYPYEYMDSWERFNETALPPIEAFYSKLSDVSISAEDYAHAQRVWTTFGCQNMGDYGDLYCRTDVLLLADVFETFRETCRHQYGLDPAHYYTAPGLSWDALLKKTGVELELLTEYDQHLFIEKGMRGGISMVSKRHARANNPRVEGYDPEKPNSHIVYLDANNLYGWAMSQALPTGGFWWVEAVELKELTQKIADIPADGSEGYILEADLVYPPELHDEHNSYPLAPERMVIQMSWMSDYQHGLLGVGVAPTEVKKLVPNLCDKERYVLHYHNLQLYLSLGMRLTKVHRTLRFSQSPWMEPYIRMNTELWKKATSGFEKDLYKLMNNSVFGKTMENLRKRVDVKLVRADEEDKMRRLIASPAFARANIFDNDLAAIQVHKSRLVLNRPVYVGMSILDMSKTLMYDFYYREMKSQYGDKCELLYTDTDSLLVEIRMDDVYRDMAKRIDLYDTSDYPKDHPLHSAANKKVLRKMKDECAGRPIAEYVGLRPKMYSILEASGDCIMKAKGVKKAVVKKHIRHEQYREALFKKKTFRHGMDVLRAERHRIYGQQLNKVSLSPFDSKRWIAQNGVATFAYGHRGAHPAGTAEMDAFIDELLG